MQAKREIAVLAKKNKKKKQYVIEKSLSSEYQHQLQHQQL